MEIIQLVKECLSLFRKKVVRFSILLLWLMWAQESATIISELGYSVEKYDESPGIYYGNKGQANLYNTEWKTVVVYVNIRKMNNQSNSLDQYIKHIVKLCQEIEAHNLTDCDHFQDTAQDKLLQIRRSEDLLNEITENKQKVT